VILNLTQHAATLEQIEAGVVDLDAVKRSQLQKLLTFDAIPSAVDVMSRALGIAEMAKAENCKKAMIGGAPFLMSALEDALDAALISAVYAFSQRVSVESVSADGTVTKVNVFKHVGFVDVSRCQSRA